MWFCLPHRSFSQLLSYLIGGGVVRLPYSLQVLSDFECKDNDNNHNLYSF